MSNLFASKIQEILLLVSDSYHIDTRCHPPKPLRNALDLELSYDIEPDAFHRILRNHTFTQLLRRHDAAQQQIDGLFRPKSNADDGDHDEDDGPKHADLLGLGFGESNNSKHKMQGIQWHRNRDRRISAPTPKSAESVVANRGSASNSNSKCLN